MQRPPRDSATFGADEAFGGIEYLHAQYVDHAFGLHAHDEYVIAVVEAGAEAFRCRGAAHVAAAGTVFTINPGEAHDGHGATPDGWRYFSIYPRHDLMARVLEADPPKFNQVVWRDPRASALVAAMHSALRGASCLLAKESAIARAFGFLAATNGSPAEQLRACSVNQRVDRIRDLLASSCDERHSLRSLSTEVSLHPNYLLSAFKRRFGVTPAAFLRTQRVALAKTLIRGGMPLHTVALDSGFCDQAHLTRCFKRALGVTPAAYAAATGARFPH